MPTAPTAATSSSSPKPPSSTTPRTSASATTSTLVPRSKTIGWRYITTNQILALQSLPDPCFIFGAVSAHLESPRWVLASNAHHALTSGERATGFILTAPIDPTDPASRYEPGAFSRPMWLPGDSNPQQREPKPYHAVSPAPATAAEWEALQHALASGRAVTRNEFPTLYVSRSDDGDGTDDDETTNVPYPATQATSPAADPQEKRGLYLDSQNLVANHPTYAGVREHLAARTTAGTTYCWRYISTAGILRLQAMGSELILGFTIKPLESPRWVLAPRANHDLARYPIPTASASHTVPTVEPAADQPTDEYLVPLPAGLPAWGSAAQPPSATPPPERPHHVPAVLTQALSLLDDGNPTDQAPIPMTFSLGLLPTGTSHWLAAVITELVLLRNITGLAPVHADDMDQQSRGIPDDAGRSTLVHGMYGVCNAFFADVTATGPPATTDMVSELAYYQSVLSRRHAVPRPAVQFMSGFSTRAPARNQNT